MPTCLQKSCALDIEESCLKKLLRASSEFFLNENFSLMALFQIRTEAGMQRGCSLASPQAQDILKPKERQKV